MEYDLHSDVLGSAALTNQAISGNGTIDGASIDTAGYESLTYFFLTGTVTDGTHAVVLEESDTGAFGGEETVVPSDEVIGGPVSIEAGDDDQPFRVGSIGKKRYQRATIVSSGVTTGIDNIGAIGVLGHAKHNPQADQNT